VAGRQRSSLDLRVTDSDALGDPSLNLRFDPGDGPRAEFDGFRETVVGIDT
jgi:hypothetical protein